MTLRDELPPPRMPGPPCRLNAYLERSSRREEWEELIADPTVESTRIWTVMRRYGFQYGQNVVARHRRGACVCAR